MEDKILAAEEVVEDLSLKVADPQIMGDPQKLADCCTKLESAEKEVRFLYDRWEELEAKKTAAGK